MGLLEPCKATFDSDDRNLVCGHQGSPPLYHTKTEDTYERQVFHHLLFHDLPLADLYEM